jgi:hypothetical protein
MKKATHFVIFLIFLVTSSSVSAYELVSSTKISESVNVHYELKASIGSKSTYKEQREQLSAEKNKAKNKTFRKNKPTDNNAASTVFAILSVIFSLTSLVIGLFLNWVVGLILLIPALLFLVLALTIKPQKETTEKESKETYRDVLYLKNGSIVKGMIVEQIPNVSFKIETGDGSVFIYKFEEVEKITKEKIK